MFYKGVLILSFNDRTIMAMGEEKYNKIANHHVLLIGVGGVGGGFPGLF